MEATAETKGRGIDAVVGFLNEKGVPYDVVDHEETYSAAAEAQAAGIEPDHAAKTMVLREGDDYRLAVIPASERLDLHKAREALGASSHLRLATEAEMEADFASFDVGATPPLGPLLPAPELLDRRLMEHDRILCSGGDHRHSVLLDPEELTRAAEAQVADLCVEDEPR